MANYRLAHAPGPRTEPRHGLIGRLSRLADLGVDQSAAPAVRRWVQTINVCALTSMVLSALFAVFYSVLDFGVLWPVIVTNVIWVGGYALGIRLNAGGHPRRASWLILATGWGNTLIPAAFLGGGTGVYLFLILVPMLGVLMSGPDDNLMRVVVIGFGALAFATMPVVFPDSTPVVRGSTVETVLFVTSAIGVSVFGSLVGLYYRRLVDVAEVALAQANAQSERLLLNILPAPIADRLRAEESPIADRADEVTVLFADIVSSTPLSERLPADELVAFLDRLFSHFDDLTEIHGLEKIATIGDCYLAVSGLPVSRPDHAAAAADMALAMRSALADYEPPRVGPIAMRFGLCSGSVVAGVIGRRKFRYDLWGDTVNTASRMESHSEPGMIHVTADVYRRLGDRYEFQPRGTILIKGKGLMETYFLLGRNTAGSPARSGGEEDDPITAHV